MRTSKRKLIIMGSEHEVSLIQAIDDRFLLIEYDGSLFEIFLGDTIGGNRLALLDGMPLKIGEGTSGPEGYTFPVGDKKIQVLLSKTSSIDLLRDNPPTLNLTRLRPSVQESGRVTAHMPGRIVGVKVKPLDKVKIGDPMFVLLAMKMENMVLAPSAGTVREVRVGVGDSVNKGDLLAVID